MFFDFSVFALFAPLPQFYLLTLCVIAHPKLKGLRKFSFSQKQKGAHITVGAFLFFTRVLALPEQNG